MQKLHHANIVLGRKTGRSLVFQFLEKDLNFDVRQNPDFWLLESESFGIDDARSLEKWALGKPFLGEIKVAFLIAGAITFEAQNALLKVLEEPTSGTYIFINLENLGNILPTFLSRVSILNNTPKVDSTPNNMALDFFRSGLKERFSLIQTLVKKENKTDMKDLIKNLERIAYTNNASSQNMQDILTAKIFTATRGSSPKMLLEWLSCVL